MTQVGFFRMLLAGSLAINLVAGLVDAQEFFALPAETQALLAQTPDPAPGWLRGLEPVAGSIASVAWIAAFVGLFGFWSWARRWALLATLSVAVYFASAESAPMSGLAFALHWLAAGCWGAVLAMAWFSPLAQRFERPRGASAGG